MRQSYADNRSVSLQDRINGRWFPKNRTKSKIVFETLGRSMGLTLRVVLRKDIGTETFSFWMVLWGFIWLRFCLVIETAKAGSESYISDFINPLAFSGFGVSVLHVLSVVFLITICINIYNTEFPKRNSIPDVLSRGESVPLAPLINDEKSFLQKVGFVQAVIAPGICFLIGLFFWFTEFSLGLAVYFLFSSIALMICEANYHRADIRYNRIIGGKELHARRRHKRRKRDNYDSYYD